MMHWLPSTASNMPARCPLERRDRNDPLATKMFPEKSLLDGTRRIDRRAPVSACACSERAGSMADTSNTAIKRPSMPKIGAPEQLKFICRERKCWLRCTVTGRSSAMQVPMPFVPSISSDQTPPSQVPQYSKRCLLPVFATMLDGDTRGVSRAKWRIRPRARPCIAGRSPPARSGQACRAVHEGSSAHEP